MNGTLSMYVPLAVVLCSAVSAGIRRATTSSAHWIHSNWGMLLFSGLGAVIAAAAQVITAKGFDLMALAVAAVGAIAGVLGGYNPSAAANDAAMPALGAVLVSPPPTPKQGGFATPGLLLVMAAALAGLVILCSGCTPAQNAAWKKIGSAVAQQCAIPGAQQALVDTYQDAQQAGATAQSVAEAVAIKDGVSAALCAAGVFFANAGDLLHAKPDPKQQIAVDALHYIQSHADELAKVVAARKAAPR